eukprot:5776198-Prymnesium_polylepis.1
MSISCHNPSSMRRARSGKIDVREWRRGGRKWMLRIGVELGRCFDDRWPLIDRSSARWSGTGGAVAKTASEKLFVAWRGAPRRLSRHAGK